jgi:hypothetical protein
MVVIIWMTARQLFLEHETVTHDDIAVATGIPVEWVRRVYSSIDVLRSDVDAIAIPPQSHAELQRHLELLRAGRGGAAW